jgi:hypothetical protein
MVREGVQGGSREMMDMQTGLGVSRLYRYIYIY